MQRTLAILKPDCVQRRLAGKVLARFENKGLRIVALKMIQMNADLAEEFYAVHKERPFFSALVQFMTSSACVPLVLEGPDAIEVVRAMLGKTDGKQANPGTIRGDFGLSTQMNLVHASDSPENASREIGIVFDPSELVEYELAVGPWLGAADD